MLEKSPPQNPAPGGSKEKKSSKKTASKDNYGYAFMSPKNQSEVDAIAPENRERASMTLDEYEKVTAPQDPLKKSIENYTLKVQGIREGVKLQRESLSKKSAQEAEQEKAREDRDALKETIAFLQTEAIQADVAGDVKKRDKLIEAKRALEQKVEKSVGEQMAEHDVFEMEGDELKNVLQKLGDKELGRYADMASREHARRTNPTPDKEPALPLPKRNAIEDMLGRQSDEDLDKFATALLDEAHKRNKADKARRDEIGKKGLEAVDNELFPKDETSGEQWEAHYKDAEAAKKNAESFGYVVSPEKLLAAARDTKIERGAAIEQNTPAEHKNFMRRMAENYRAMPKWIKYSIGGALLAGGVSATILGGPASVMTALWIAQRGMSGLGAYAIADAETERWKSRYLAGIVSGGVGIAAAFAVPSFVQYLDQNYLHIGDWLRGQGFGRASNPGGVGQGNPLFDPHPTPGAPAFEPAPGVGAEVANLFDSTIEVTDKDRLRGLWGILERKLTDANIIDSSTPSAKKNLMIDFLEKKLDALGPEGVKKLGFVSGDIDVIHKGEKLDLSILDKEGWIKQIKLFR